MLAHPSSNSSANGIRTRVWALRGPHRLSVRTAPFHGAERGSIPLGAMGNRLLNLIADVVKLVCVCWGRSSVWLEHSTVTREVAGSSPVGPVELVNWCVGEWGGAVSW